MAHLLNNLLRRASAEHWAIPHYNISNLEQLRGIAEAANELRSPVMIGTSEGERTYIGLDRAVALVASYAAEFNLPIFLNADHTKSVAAAKAAIDAGYLSIHIDLSKLPYKENLAGTTEVVRYARKVNPNISVEGELGALATDSSKIYKGKIEVDPASLTNPEQAVEFFEKTGVNRLAPAVGNFHGLASNKKKLDIDRIKRIHKTLPHNVSLVLHGGSGSGAAAFKKAVAAGIANVHISTDLRVAFSKALRDSIKKQPDESTPYKLLEPTIVAVKKEAMKYIKIFGANGRV